MTSNVKLDVIYKFVEMLKYSIVCGLQRIGLDTQSATFFHRRLLSIIIKEADCLIGMHG